MQHGIVPGEPGIFPAHFAKWYAKFLERRTGKGKRPPDEDTPPPPVDDAGDLPRDPDTGPAGATGPEPPSGT